MDNELTQRLAKLWRRITATDRDKLFGDYSTHFQDRNWGDRVAQPGYVGTKYRTGGLVFVSMNPGGGPQEGLSTRDIRQYEGLHAIRDAKDEDVASEFLNLIAMLHGIMPTWKIYQNFVSPVLADAALDFSQVAYLNLLKWRTSSSSGLTGLYDISWRDHTEAQFDLLQPNVVIAVGKDAGTFFQRHAPDLKYFQAIPRVIGNNVGPAGYETMAAIADWLQKNPFAVV